MNIILILLIELTFLFLLSRQITKRLMRFFYRVFKDKRKAVIAYSVVFLPGTFIHEMAHFLTALVLFVPVGQVKIFPEIDDEEKIKMGSVAVAKVDFLRRFLVGIAPLIVGIGLILFIISQLTNRQFAHWGFTAFAIYVVFQVGNTMYTSRQDLTAALELVVFLAVLSVILYLLGVRITLDADSFFIHFLTQTTNTAVRLMLIPLGVDAGVILLLKLPKILRPR